MPVAVLPAVASHFGTSPPNATLTLTVFFLSAAVTAPLSARCGDRFGRRNALLTVLALFLTGSIVSALAPSIFLFVLGRALQGVAGGSLVLTSALVRDSAGADLAFGLGAVATAFGAGNAVGPVIGASMVDRFGLSAQLWLLVALSLACLLVAGRWLPTGAAGSRRPLHLGAAALLAVGLGALLLALANLAQWGFGSLRFLTVAFAGCVLLCTWARWESHLPDPLLNLGLLRRRRLLAPNMAGFVVAGTTSGFWFLVPAIAHTRAAYGYGLGLSLTAATLFLLPPALVMFAAGSKVGAIAGRRSGRGLAIGGVLTTSAGLAVLAFAPGDAALLAAGAVIVGIGLTLFLASMSVLIVAAVPSQRAGESTAANLVVRMVGATLGAQATAAILAASWLDGTEVPSSAGCSTAFAAMAVVCLAAGGSAALWTPRGGVEPAGSDPWPLQAASR